MNNASSAMRPLTSMLAPASIIALPGMGATAEMHSRVGSLIPNFKSVEWPNIDGCNDFSDLAVRCIEIYGINKSHVLVGSSMGGMVAGEIARILGNQHLVLIGSCLNSKSIGFGGLAKFSSHIMSDGLIKLIGSKGSISMLSRMIKQVDPQFIRWSLQKIGGWKGVNVSELKDVHSIHGMIDPIIPITRVSPDEIIPTGGHFIAISHPKTVAKFIVSSLNKRSC